MLSYQHDESGEWLVLAMPLRLLLVRRDGSPESTTRLWNALGTDTGTQAVLDELTSGGLSRAPAFALLTWNGELSDIPATVHTIVRGDISVQLDAADGPRTVTGRAISTWVEQTHTDVMGFTVSTDGADQAGLRLPIGSGVVRANAVTSTAVTSTAVTSTAVTSTSVTSTTDAAAPLQKAAPGSAVPEQVVPEHAVPEAVAPEVPAPEAAVSERAAAPAPAPATKPTPVAIGEETIVNLDADEPVGPERPEFGSTVVRETDHAPAAKAEPADRPASRDDGSRIDLPPFITGSGPVPATSSIQKAAAPPSPTAQLPADPGTGDHDGMTVMSGDIQKLRNSRKQAAGRPESAPAPPSPYLLLPSGAREALTQPVLVGRSPSVSKVSGGQVPRLVSLGGADQDISRNHVQFQVEGDTVVVTDLHSRNGTMIVLPGKAPQKLRQGEPTSVIVGTIVDLGSGISLTVCED